jgi:hypothetical protein
MRIQFKNLDTGENILDRELLPSQESFWNATERYVLFSGGYGCGKSMMLILKTIYDAMSKDDNYILMGRRSYTEIHDVLLKDFFELCHPSWVEKYTKSPQPAVVLKTFSGNTSEIIFRNLDRLSENEIKGLNLGGYSIDQAEDVPELVCIALNGRMRRFNRAYHMANGFKWDDEKKEGEVKPNGYMTANPALSWLYRAFKEENNPEYRLIEASTLENEANLPKEYVEDLKSYPERLYKQYVLGIWDEALFAENAVFAPEFLEGLVKNLKDPITTKEGLNIFYTKEDHIKHHMQIGIDVAEGADTIEERHRATKKDNAVITIVCHDCELELAKWAGRLPPNATADKAVLFASWYNDPLMVPEMNSMGTALVNRLQDSGYNNIYQRYEFDRTINRRTKKLGFRTTAASKQLLIERFNFRLRKCNPTIHSRDTYSEMKHFVYSDLAAKKGAGAQEGHHDDKVMSLLLAFYTDSDPSPSAIKRSVEHKKSFPAELVPAVSITSDGKFKPPKFWRDAKLAKWTLK